MLMKWNQFNLGYPGQLRIQAELDGIILDTKESVDSFEYKKAREFTRKFKGKKCSVTWSYINLFVTIIQTWPGALSIK